MDQTKMRVLRGLRNFILTLFIIAPAIAQAQNDMVNFLQAGPEDASKLMNAYLNPAVEGLSYGFNGGWFTTAKAHKSFGFDIGISANAVFIPSSMNHFNANDLNLQTTTLVSPTDGEVPTMVGPADKSTYWVDADQNGQVGSGETFSGPKGLDLKDVIKVSSVGAPTANVGIGIYKNTDLKIRWMPEVKVGDSKIKLIGAGVLHDIKQHIPGMKLLAFDLSVLAAFTQIKGSTGMDGVFDSDPADTRPQKMDFEMNAWLVQAIISKKLKFVTFYGGVGYNAVKSTADVTGSYDIFNNGTVVFKDPVNLDFRNNSMRLTGGMRLKMAIFYLSADYTLQEYSTVSVGFGVSVK